MATRGRKPKPTVLKILEGNPGKRPINENEPIPPKGTVKCPTWLEPEAKKEWKRLAPSLEAMGVLTQADLTAFAGYCQAFSRMAHPRRLEGLGSRTKTETYICCPRS